MKTTLIDMGLKGIHIQSIENEFDQGYEGIIFITGRKG